MPDIAPSPYEIQLAFADLVREALDSLDLQHVVVHEHWILGEDKQQAAKSLSVVTLGHPEFGKVHGWMVGLAGKARKRPDLGEGQEGAGRLKRRGPNRRDLTVTLKVWACHWHKMGDKNDNSTKRLDRETELVSDFISESPTFGLDNDKVQGHEELQFHTIGDFILGDRLTTVAQGNITIRLYKPVSAGI